MGGWTSTGAGGTGDRVTGPGSVAIWPLYDSGPHEPSAAERAGAARFRVAAPASRRPRTQARARAWGWWSLVVPPLVAGAAIYGVVSSSAPAHHGPGEPTTIQLP